MKSFGSGDAQELGGKFYAVNVACLDDATGEELAQAPITYENGWNDRWDQPPLKRATSEYTQPRATSDITSTSHRPSRAGEVNAGAKSQTATCVLRRARSTVMIIDEYATGMCDAGRDRTKPTACLP